MYKLQEIQRKTDYAGYRDEEPFEEISILMYDLENRLPYGRGGGTDYTNTNFRCLSLKLWRYRSSWYNTDRSVADHRIAFAMNEFMIKGDEKYIDYDENKLIENIEEMFETYMKNIFFALGDGEIKTDGKKRFWSDNGFIFTIKEHKKDIDNNTHQNYTFKVTQSSYDGVVGNQVYFRDSDKSRGKLPKKSKPITKEELIAKIRPEFVKVANWFLSQEFDKSLIVPSASDIISMNREEAKKLLDDNVYSDRTVLREVIK